MAGDRIPNEAELSRVHGVSRITVRHALGLLCERGLIERFPRRGSFVSPPQGPGWTISSIEDVVQVGAETEVEILDWAPVQDPIAAGRLGSKAGGARRSLSRGAERHGCARVLCRGVRAGEHGAPDPTGGLRAPYRCSR